jgi:ankyrin repeat protein
VAFSVLFQWGDYYPYFVPYISKRSPRIENQASLHSTDDDRETVLSKAIENGHEAVMQLLLDPEAYANED